MDEMKRIKDFYSGKMVFVTGHTGFKGAWLCEILLSFGARVIGYALPPENESLFNLLDLSQRMTSYFGDIRDFQKLHSVFEKQHPEIVFHLAAQPIVLRSYQEPVETYQTNVMGTVNVCECVRLSESVRSFVNVTTDKVYENIDAEIHAFKENEKLDGTDPYSNSKSCSELVTHTYDRSFLEEKGVSVSTARAGNVIGGGDFAEHRIVPDFIRSLESGAALELRHPESIRPFQHVLDALHGYLYLAMAQAQDPSIAGSYNIGPDKKDICSVGELVRMMGEYMQPDREPITVSANGMGKEANYLFLDNGKIKGLIPTFPVLDLQRSVEWTAKWYKAYLAGDDVTNITRQQIAEFFAL